jgi:DNA-binding MarR family transcriptional regulator
MQPQLHNPLETLLSHQLRRASNASTERLNARLKGAGLKPSEASVLIVLEANPYSAQSDIGRSLGIQSANMPPLIAGLERRGLICRAAVDRRSHSLSLTPAGAVLHKQALGIIREHDAILSAPLAVEAAEALRDALCELGRENDASALELSPTTIASPSKPLARDAGLASERLSELLGFHMGLANIAIQRDFAAAVAELSLTRKQYAVLELISTNIGVSQTKIAGALGMDRATTMALVDRLTGRNLVQRHAAPNDRRRQELHLTKAGVTFLKDVAQVIWAHEERLFAQWSKSEREALRDALQRVYRSAA